MTLTVDQILALENPKLSIPGLRTDIPEIPRPYQIADAIFLNLRPRAVLAEYPGVGKKLIVMIALLKLFENFKARNALVLSMGADVSQWVEDLHHFTEGVTIQEYRGSAADRHRLLRQEVDIRVATHNTVVNDLRHLIGKHDVIIIDEVSYYKNYETAAHEHTRTLCAPSLNEQMAFFRDRFLAANPGRHFPGFSPPGQPAAYCWGITATPMETSPLDIFSLFWILQGGMSVLGVNPLRYKTMFCVIQRSRVRVPKQTPQGIRRVPITIEKVVGAAPENLQLLKSRIKEHYIRHPWEVVEPFLPPLEVLPIWLELGKKQKERYREISSGRVIADYIFADRHQRVTAKQVSYAVKLFYQMRCCDGLTSLPGQHYRDSVKLTKCMELLTGELGLEKVVVFSRFHQPLNDLETRLNEELITWTRIDGKRTEDENTVARLAFQDPDGPRVLLMTNKGSYALNFQIARYMICYNLLYNPKRLEQLFGRIRRGTADLSPRIIYPLMTKFTIEEAQWLLLRDRENTSNEIFDDESELFDSLTPSEQRGIVNYGLGAVD